MGCTQSKIENEEAVTRCKARKQFMKDAVTARNALAAAHSGYTVALKNTGAALSDFAHGDVLLDYDHHQSQQPSSSQLPPPPLPPDPLPPPPPPLPNFPPILQRAATMPEFSVPKPDPKPTETIQEEDDGENEETPDEGSLKHRRRNTTTGGGGGRRMKEQEEEGMGQEVDPRSPSPRVRASETIPPPPPPESQNTAWEYFFPMVQDMGMSSLSQNDEIQSVKDVSDGGGHGDSRFKREENVGGDHGVEGGTASTATTTAAAAASTSGSSSQAEPHIEEKVIEAEMVKPIKKPKQNSQLNSVATESKRGRKGRANLSLQKILDELDEHFLRASVSAAEVARMLEANRMHYHSNFADNRGHIDHSKKLMRVITWNRSFRGLQNADDEIDDFDTQDTLASVLDKLLAWEKKLYDEVKVGELMKIEYQKKIALLNKQKKRGTNFEALEKTKAAVTHLHTRYIVDMQSLDSTVSEIDHLRDDLLYPRLVSLVSGLAKMWETMNYHHREQLEIVVEDLRTLDIAKTPHETSEEHHGRTVQLWNVVGDWHANFVKFVTFQKDYIQALNSWLKLNLIPIESSLKEKVSSPPRVDRPPIQILLHAWQDNLERLPDQLARSAISSFAHIIESIMLHQQDEVKLKMKLEETRKELARKTRAFEDWYHKHNPIHTPADELDPEKDLNHKDPLAQRQFVIDSLKQRLEEEMEDHQKHCRQVREKSLTNLKTHLPELFRAMSDFTSACTISYRKLQSIAQSQDPTGSSS